MWALLSLLLTVCSVSEFQPKRRLGEGKLVQLLFYFPYQSHKSSMFYSSFQPLCHVFWNWHIPHKENLSSKSRFVKLMFLLDFNLIFFSLPCMLLKIPMKLIAMVDYLITLWCELEKLENIFYLQVSKKQQLVPTTTSTNPPTSMLISAFPFATRDTFS